MQKDIFSESRYAQKRSYGLKQPMAMPSCRAERLCLACDTALGN